MAENYTDQFDSIRSILRTNDELHIRPSGDFNQVCLKLEYEIHISFVYDPLSSSAKSFTINNVNDLRIYKVTKKNALNNEQWIAIRDYFNMLIQQSNPETTLFSIIQLIQEYLLQISSINFKHNDKTSITTTITASKVNASTLEEKFRGADLIFNRIKYDTTIDHSHVIIGYEDRFTGIRELKFNEFKKVHENEVRKFFFLFSNHINTFFY